MKKIGRNDPCHCGSGKKFKKCCESKMIGGRYMATKIDSAAAPQLANRIGLSGLFNRQISAISKPFSDHKPIRATRPLASAPSPVQPVQSFSEPAVATTSVTEKVE